MKKGKEIDKFRLQHILEAIEHIEEFTLNVTESEYMNDIKLQAAVERKIEIIGEASKHLSDDLIQKYPNTEWLKIKAFRNIIVHEYFGVSQKIIWDSIKIRIPELKKTVLDILKSFK